MTDVTFKYEDEIAGHMQEFTIKESSRAFNIEVPGISPQDATADTPAIAGTPTRNWAFPKDALAQVFPHGREDMAAMCDFIQAAWAFHRVPDVLPDTMNKPSEGQIKLTMVCKKFSGTLLEALGVTQYAQFRELSKAVDMSTTEGAKRAAEAQAVKDAKAAERKAARDAKNAEAKAEKDKIKAEKKAAKEKEKAEKKEAEKKRIEEARMASVAAKNAEVAKNGGKTDAEVEKAEKKGKFTGKTKLSKEEKAELARVEAERTAEQERIRAEKAKMDAEFEEGEKPKTDADAVADAILAGDDTQQG